MSQTMKDVKAITIPQGTVKKIEDSNGNIIWGSQADFPYRRLEYIQGNKMTYGINSGQAPRLNSYMKLDVAFINDSTNTNNSYQIGRGAVSNNQRFAVGATRSNNKLYLFGGLGNNWNTYTNRELGETRHVLTVQGPDCIKYGTGQGYSLDGTFISTTNTVNNPGTWYTVFLFTSRGNTNDTDAAQGEVSCKLYYAEIGYKSSSAEGLNGRYWPAQRKSDGVIGLMGFNYAGTAYFLTPRAGETGTLTAGPVADEYWDGTTIPSN